MLVHARITFSPLITVLVKLFLPGWNMRKGTTCTFPRMMRRCQMRCATLEVCSATHPKSKRIKGYSESAEDNGGWGTVSMTRRVAVIFLQTLQ